MADQKISQLNELTTWADDDEFAIVDTDLNTTKRMTAANVKANALSGLINFSVSSETIAVGVITASSSYIRMDTEGGAAADDLDTINGGSVGDIIVIRQVNATRDITIKHNTGNCRLAGGADFTFDTARATMMLIYSGIEWLEISRSANT